MSIDHDILRKPEIVTPITSKQNVNTGAQGDCLYLPVISMISNSTSYDSSGDKESSLNLEYITDNCFRSNLISSESKENQVCFLTSSATFIVPSPPSNKPIQQDAYNTHNMIDSNTSMKLLTSTRTCHDHQQQLWFIRQHWISVTIITGIIVIFIIIITITIIIH
jgi:hypothetical protein